MADRRLAVIVLAAGAGTRMKSRTPKVLHRLAGAPLIQHVLATATALGPDHLLTVLRHERDLIAPEVTRIAPSAVIVDQDEVPGTGRAAELALANLPADFVGDVVILSGDVPLLDAASVQSLIDYHRGAGAALTLLSAVLDDPTGFGRILRDEAGAFTGIIEHKDASEHQLAIAEINAGVYVVDAAALREALAGIGTDNAQGEKYLTDAAAVLHQRGAKVDAVQVADHWLVAGINDRVQLSEVAAEFNARIVRHWQRQGVTIHDPRSTWIDVDVVLAEDVELFPDVQLRGATVVARGAKIGPDTTLVDTEVGEGAVIKRTDATLAVIGAGASVGPFAYLRPGTVLGAKGKIGTFVETKNSQIGDGAKVPHLSYIGDATIGEGTNIGAGAITANYDGQHKHRTEIGAKVRTGSHNVFVAPVRIGDGAYTAAGSTIRKDVPPGSLGMTVAPQRNVDGWVAEHRPAKPAEDAPSNGGSQ